MQTYLSEPDDIHNDPIIVNHPLFLFGFNKFYKMDLQPKDFPDNPEKKRKLDAITDILTSKPHEINYICIWNNPPFEIGFYFNDDDDLHAYDPPIDFGDDIVIDTDDFKFIKYKKIVNEAPLVPGPEDENEAPLEPDPIEYPPENLNGGRSRKSRKSKKARKTKKGKKSKKGRKSRRHH